MNKQTNGNMNIRTKSAVIQNIQNIQLNEIINNIGQIFNIGPGGKIAGVKSKFISEIVKAVIKELCIKGCLNNECCYYTNNCCGDNNVQNLNNFNNSTNINDDDFSLLSTEIFEDNEIDSIESIDINEQ